MQYFAGRSLWEPVGPPDCLAASGCRAHSSGLRRPPLCSVCAMRADSELRQPNFDALRLLGAVMVLFSHAFAITEGTEANEPLFRVFGKGNIAGLYGVFIFFIISGFLITRSFLVGSSVASYLIKRFFRIIPGLVLCVVLTVFVLGPLVTRYSSATYFGSISTYSYAGRTLALTNTSGDGLPGLVFTSNDFGQIINGSLWTLGPEFVCYLGVAVLGAFRMLRLWSAAALLALGLWTHAHPLGFAADLKYLLPYFAAGCMWYFVFPYLRRAWIWAPFCLAGLAAAAALDHPAAGFAVFGSYLIILVGTSTTIRLGAVTRFGDLSYGTYLYGWPVEETVRHFAGAQAHWWQVFAVSVPVSATLAWLSWNLVEARSLRAGRKLARLTAGGPKVLLAVTDAELERLTGRGGDMSAGPADRAPTDIRALIPATSDPVPPAISDPAPPALPDPAPEHDTPRWAAAQNEGAVSTVSRPGAHRTFTEQLDDLAQLRLQGLLTDEEFSIAKTRLFDVAWTATSNKTANTAPRAQQINS